MTRAISAALVLALSVLAPTASAQELVLPFEGRWFVAQGGDTPNVNHHMAVRAQWYGVDFARVAGPGGRALASVDTPSKVGDFFSWNQPVLSPVDGVVASVVDDLPDNPLGKKDTQRPAGNHVAIRTGQGTYIFLAHLRQGSVTARPGDRVARRQPIGRVGNSGNSDFPHLHVHMQDGERLNEGQGLNLVFSGIDVELSGKTFENVTWPLIRGLFVRAR